MLQPLAGRRGAIRKLEVRLSLPFGPSAMPSSKAGARPENEAGVARPRCRTMFVLFMADQLARPCKRLLFLRAALNVAGA